MSTNEPFLTKIFNQLKETNRLGHGYLFFGESSEARGVWGRSFLHFLENGDWNSSEYLIDGIFIEAINGVIGIDSVREAIKFVWQTPFRSKHRAVFLDGDSLTLEAQNSLLKIAEEPPSRGIIILGARNPESLVPPLASRLEKFYIAKAKKRIENKLAQKFLHADIRSRKDIIKLVTSDDRPEAVEEFVEALLIECRKDSFKNLKMMRALLDRWTKISELNTNKKLQLETLIAL